MSVTRQIAHNTFYQVAGKVASTALGFITVGIMTRYLGKEGFGQYTTIITFLQFFAIFIDMGLYLIVIQYISKPHADVDKILSNIFTLRVITSVIFLGLAPLVVLLFPYTPIVKIGVAFTTLSFLFITLNQTLLGILQKHFVTYKTAISEILGRIVLLGGTALVAYLGWNILGIMGAVVLGSFANFIATFIQVKKYAAVRFRFDWDLWKQVLHDAWPLTLSIIFNLVYFKADTLILTLTKSQTEVGIYGAAYKVLEILTTFPAMFAGLMTPLLAAAFAEKNMEQFKKYLQQGFNFLTIVAIPLIVGTLLLGEDVIVFVCGKEFADAGIVLKIIIFATAAIFVGNLFGNTIVAINKQRSTVKLYAMVAVIALVGYLIFIPRYSYIGAASMTVVAEGIIMLSVMYIVLKNTKIRLNYSIILKALLASIFMGVIMYLLRNLNFIILICIGFPAYIIALYLLRGFTKEMVRDILKVRKNV